MSQTCRVRAGLSAAASSPEPPSACGVQPSNASGVSVGMNVNHLAGRQMAQEHGAKLDTVGQVDLDAAVLQRRRRGRDRAASLRSRAAPRSQGAEGSAGRND